MPSLDDLHEYQHRAIAFIKSEKRCALYLDMGLGKTVSTLTAISDLLDGCAVRRVLIVAPLRVANSVWRQESAKWLHLAHLRVSVCTGSERERMAALMVTADAFVINRENIEWLVLYYGKKWPFDCVVIDESDSFKNPSSKRFKALKRTLPDTTHFILLSGTPSPNGLLDIWSQLYMIDFGERLGRTMGGYKSRFFECDFMGYKFTPRTGSADKIHGLIADKVLSMSSEDYLELPERIDLVETVQLPAKVLKQYKEFEASLFAELPSGEEVEAVTAAVLANKLLQWCNGAIYTDDLHNFEELHTAKLDALAEIIESNPDENILIAYNYKSDLARLLTRFPVAVALDKNPNTITRWNDGGIKLLLAHPASAGHGINLQLGGCVAVWFGLTWSLGNYQQFNARLRRQGQQRPVRIIHIVVNGCLDQRVMSVLADKGVVQSALLKALKLF
jgi:SNF2 family DNA or RNA helicase